MGRSFKEEIKRGIEMKRVTFVKDCSQCKYLVYDAQFGYDCMEYLQSVEVENGKYLRCEGCKRNFPSGHLKITIESADADIQESEDIFVLTEKNVRIGQHIVHQDEPKEIWVVHEIKAEHNIVIKQWEGFGRDLVVPKEFFKWRIIQ